MTPVRSSAILMRFASQLSPWWLLVIVPAVCAAGWALSRKERQAIGRLPGMSLSAFRGIMLAALVLLAFRPSLVLREQLTYPGRLIFLLDNSESMTARDTAMPEADALQLHRRLRGDVEGVPQPFFDRARQVEATVAHLRRFEAVSQRADRRQDSFWIEAENAQQQLLSDIEAVAEPIPEHEGIPDQLRMLQSQLSRELESLGARSSFLFAGERHPGAPAFDRICDAFGLQANQLQQLQIALDADATEERAQALADTAAAIRATPRIALMGEAIERMRTLVPERLAGQGLQILPLMGGEATGLAAFDRLDFEARYGETDIAGRLTGILNAEHEFPLTGLILASDGRDLSGIPPEQPAQAAARRQIPVFTAAVGATAEPADVAIQDVIAPPYAIQGRPVRVRARIKVSDLPAVESLTLALTRNGVPIASREVDIPATGSLTAELTFTPDAAGTDRYALTIPSQDGEIFPLRNNTKEFVLTVREDPVRVLLLDWKPGWETRFALNILQRLDYVDLNAIVILTSEDGELARGVRKGTWPRDAAMLEIYDLIVMGAVPEAVLTPDEWDAIDGFVREQGKTLFLLGADAAHAVPERLREQLLPVSLPLPDRPGLDALALAGPGQGHPLSFALTPLRLPAAAADSIRGLHPEAHPLLADGATLAPVLTTRYSGPGRVAYLGHDTLWKRLNPEALDAHAAVFLNAVSWALAPSEPLMLDTAVVSTRQPLQIWLPAAPQPPLVELLMDGLVIAEAAGEPVRAGAAQTRAHFTALPPGPIAVRVSGVPELATIHVVEHYRELDAFAVNHTLLRTLASETGGLYGTLPDLPHFLSQLEPKSRIERNEQTFRLWDSGWILALLLVWISTEWIWRKFAGLV